MQWYGTCKSTGEAPRCQSGLAAEAHMFIRWQALLVQLQHRPHRQQLRLRRRQQPLQRLQLRRHQHPLQLQRRQQHRHRGQHPRPDQSRHRDLARHRGRGHRNFRCAKACSDAVPRRRQLINGPVATGLRFVLGQALCVIVSKEWVTPVYRGEPDRGLRRG